MRGVLNVAAVTLAILAGLAGWLAFVIWLHWPVVLGMAGRNNPQPARIARWVRGVAGSWGLPGTGIYRPPSAPIHRFTTVRRVAIRPGEGTKTATISAAGTAVVSIGPDALITWYVDYVSIETQTGAADTSTCSAQVGPAGTGIVPSGQSYSGGGDVISMGGRALRPGDYVTLAWSGGHPGDQATATIYGSQDILV